MVKVYNSTKNNTIADAAIVAKSFLTRSIGLLSRKFISENECLIIEPCFSIHTFFMRFPIDVLFVDRKNKIVAAYENVLPNRILPVHLSSQYVVELAAGQILKKNIEKCDIIQVDEQ